MHDSVIWLNILDLLLRYWINYTRFKRREGLLISNLIFIHFMEVFGVDYGAQKIWTASLCYTHHLQA